MSEVDKPLHYQTVSGMQPIDVIEAFELGFNLGNAIKYILRAGKKDHRTTDLSKALWYIQRELGEEVKSEALPYYREGRKFVITKSNSPHSGDAVGKTLTYQTIDGEAKLVDEDGLEWGVNVFTTLIEGCFGCDGTTIEFEPEDA